MLLVGCDNLCERGLKSKQFRLKIMIYWSDATASVRVDAQGRQQSTSRRPTSTLRCNATCRLDNKFKTSCCKVDGSNLIYLTFLSSQPFQFHQSPEDARNSSMLQHYNVHCDTATTVLPRLLFIITINQERPSFSFPPRTIVLVLIPILIATRCFGNTPIRF
jgi:hypothetical protein